MRSLAPGKHIMENGIRFEKLHNGDGRFSIDVMVNRRRIHRVLGLESEGVTRIQAEEAIELLKTEARQEWLNLPKGRKTPLSFREAASRYIAKLEQTDGKNLEAKKRHLLHMPKEGEQACDYLRQFFGNKPLDQLDTFDVNRYKKWRRDAGTSNGTINRELATLSHMLGQAREWGWTKTHPIIQRLKEEQTRTIYLNKEQAERVLTIARQDTNNQVLS